MIKVILADDEPLALTLLQHMIDWKRFGLTLCGCAKNGDELYQMIFEQNPEIVITDIRMPGRSGLEIIAKTLEAGLPTRFIIISSHTSFEYARKAIQLGAEDFLPKPVSRAELVKTLNIVLEKLKAPEAQEESCRKLIQTAKGYIESNFEKHLTLESVASQVYVSASYLSTLFKKETGVNFSEYLTNVRMENAKRLLREAQYTIAQVAEMVGYKDVKHFSSVFQKYYQVSPSQYRK
ncbi:MAG: helix-turn-helix domain-containing protein [Lachnospiraceae bacterium]|nr:helix-turn-helix domain-containing protein [Lachnospiraceae bacterium]